MPLALYMLALAVFVMGTSEFMLAGLLPAIAVEVDVSVANAGLLTSAFALRMAIGAPVMAAVSRLWAARTALLTCLILFAVCHVIGAVTSAFSVLLVCRVISALANAGFLAVALTTATRLVAPNRKGRALAVLLSGTTVATVAGVPAGALLATAWSWRATFWAVALLCLPAAVSIAISVPRERINTARISEGPSLRTELRQLRAPRLALTMLLGALVNGATFAAFTFLAPVVTDVAGMTDPWVAVALVLFGFGSFLGVISAGRLADRHPHIVIAVGGPLLLTGWVALGLSAAHPVALLGLVFAQGVLAFAVGSTCITRVLYAASGAPTMGGSYATAALNVGAAAGPAVAAAAMVSGAGVLAPAWVAAALTGLAVVLALPLVRFLLPPSSAPVSSSLSTR